MKKRALLFSFLILFFPDFLQSQNSTKKVLDHEDFAIWKSIKNTQISNNGRWVSYILEPGEGDAQLVLYDGQNQKDHYFDRGSSPKFSSDDQFLVFKIKPHLDSTKNQRRRKVKKEKLPKDSLGLFNLSNGELHKIPNVKSFQLPKKWAGYLAYQLASSSKKSKKEGSTLVIRNLLNGKEQQVGFVKDYIHAEEGAKFALSTTGKDSTYPTGVYIFNTKDAQLKTIYQAKGKYAKLKFDKKGAQLAFLADLDTTKARIKYQQILHWKDGQTNANTVVSKDASFLPKDWMINEHSPLQFAEDGSKLYFGIAPKPILVDTNLLKEEIVNVEVWSYTDARLHTQQKVLLEQEKKRTYACVLHLKDQKVIQLGRLNLPEIRFGNEGNANIALGYNEEPYLPKLSWVGFPGCKDLSLVNLSNGSKKAIGQEICGSPSLSPSAKFAFWFSAPDTAWFTYSIAQHKVVQITNNTKAPFYDELNDRPMLPSSYGVAAWVEDDANILINDRYDIWKVDPTGQNQPKNLTKGRSTKTTYRYIKTDPEKRFLLKNERILLHVFEHISKKQGYAWLDLSSGKLIPIITDNYTFSRRPFKAKDANKWVFTKENFQNFPDLLYSNDLVTFSKISNANPQQKDYTWGNIELYHWTSADGQQLQGLLVKPDDFDPSKKYPLIVNFYERSTDGLHRHRAPEPHRSTINYSFYTSRGYVIFNPDVPYRIGYPGESAYNAVISGTSSLIDEGFIDKDNIGVQGHSWGGYQIAYLLTKTDLFKCAESGAPVVNMISAYGGIRWGSGLSRMFQYERTQSRIGGTLWEMPLRYIDNSPIFTVDKINTPVLILHNDKDSAVPWYQGIEWFVAMRRLGKPAWMLNYNGEPHWPLKLQNRKDFQKRMQQFFDYYLKGAPKPMWMERGVPAIEKGIRQGYETDY